MRTSGIPAATASWVQFWSHARTFKGQTLCEKPLGEVVRIFGSSRPIILSSLRNRPGYVAIPPHIEILCAVPTARTLSLRVLEMQCHPASKKRTRLVGITTGQRLVSAGAVKERSSIADLAEMLRLAKPRTKSSGCGARGSCCGLMKKAVNTRT